MNLQMIQFNIADVSSVATCMFNYTEHNKSSTARKYVKQCFISVLYYVLVDNTTSVKYKA